MACVTSAAVAADAGQAPAWRTATFSAVSLRVPSTWPVWNLARQPDLCPRLNVHAVYLGTPGPDPACPSAAAGKTEAVQIEPLNPQSPDVLDASTAATIGGRAAMTNSGDAALTHTIVDVLPSAGVEVSLSYGSDPALIRQIESTITIGAGARSIPASTKTTAPAAAVPVPAAARHRVFLGDGFDTCAAPSTGAMQAWRASRYRAVGIYIGGLNRACAQFDLSASWIRSIGRQGWYYFPIYLGREAPCASQGGLASIEPSRAAPEGSFAARDAVAQARHLGIPKGTPIIYDMEQYNGDIHDQCGSAVIRFLSHFDRGLLRAGYRSGVYESFSNVGDLTGSKRRMTEPSVIYYADWDGRPTVQSRYMPRHWWTHDQRIHQYVGGVNETWRGVTMNIDRDRIDTVLAR